MAKGKQKKAKSTPAKPGEEAAVNEEEGVARPLFLDEMTPSMIRDYLARTQSIIIPLGATEPHGDHLPVGTDSFCALGLCERLSSQTGLAIAPSMPYGYLDRMIGHPGAITLSRETYGAVVAELFEQFAQSGVRFFVIASGHGPNRASILEGVRRVVERHRAQFLVVEWYLLAERYMEGLFGTPDIGHGGIVEVAAMRQYRSELVHMERATPDSFTSWVPGVIAFPYQRTAVVADASAVMKADPGRMAQLMAAVERETIELVRDALAAFRTVP